MLSAYSLALAMLALAGLIDTSIAENITSDLFFYGQSPPVYPTRKLSFN